jgi:hypothetical protein
MVVVKSVLNVVKAISFFPFGCFAFDYISTDFYNTVQQLGSIENQLYDRNFIFILKKFYIYLESILLYWLYGFSWTQFKYQLPLMTNLGLSVIWSKDSPL